MSSEDQDEQYQDEGSEDSIDAGEDGSTESDFVTEQPRKSISQSTLVILALLSLVVGATYLMVIRTGPSKALGDANSQADVAGQMINTFLGGGANNIHVMEMMLQKTASVVARFRSYPGTQQVPLSQLQTNPFHFASLDAPKADTDEDTVKKMQEEKVQATIAAARLLRLQSVLMGSVHKSCIIDGKVYSEGQPIGQFTLLQIKPRSIIVQSDGLKLELLMHAEQMP